MVISKEIFQGFRGSSIFSRGGGGDRGYGPPLKITSCMGFYIEMSMFEPTPFPGKSWTPPNFYIETHTACEPIQLVIFKAGP